MDRAEIVVIGGGIAGCSVAYHLAKAGRRDLLLLDKAELTSGSTCQAVGLVTQYNPSPTMMRFRRYSIELYRELGVFESVGSLRLASSAEQFMELQRGVSRAKGIGLEVDLLSTKETLRLMPAATERSLFGALYVEGDGHLDPHTATHALAKAARERGLRIRTGVRVTGIELSERGHVRAVQTEQGRIETEVVVVAAGMWAPQVAAMAGARVPSTPIDHQHIALRAVRGAELPHDMPCFRDPDNLVYGRSEAGGVLFGGYEPDPVARWVDGVPWEHSATSLPPDYARFEQLMRGAIRRFPFLAEAEVVKLICHPDAMTPDANPLLGPLPGIPGLFLAAGLSLNGFGGAGGIGRALAELIIEGDAGLDVTPYRAWRFGPNHTDPSYAAELAREAYKYYYLLRYPLDQDEWGRPRRTSALHVRLQDLGAAFGVKNGWERAEYFHPHERWHRIGADQRAWGWTRPPYLDRVAEEHAAARERVGIIDMSSFGKIEVRGPGALGLLERVADNLIDRPVGTVVYTQFLNGRGGIVADVTVTRLADDRFRVITGAAAIDGDLGWLRANARDHDPPVELRDATGDLAVIGLWGPAARSVLSLVTSDDVSGAGFPFMRARTITLAGTPVLAQRITYVGELGWELYVDPERAVQVWDRLMDAGRDAGISPMGYRAIDSLRMEKGYRAFGVDLTASDDPFEAGLGFCVRLDKGPFTGKAALEAARAGGLKRRLRTLLIGGGEYVPLYGGEAVLTDGRVAGRVRSAAFGFTVRRNMAYAYLPVEIEEGSRLDVEVFGRHAEAEVAPDVVHDPGGKAITS